MKRSLIVWGGWDGHEPESVAELFKKILESEGHSVEMSDSLDSFLQPLEGFDLIVPVWTMGEITFDQCSAVCRAVAEGGTGIAGAHGGMCDAFRGSTEWQFMTGGQWVAHPGDDNVTYKVNFSRSNPHEITNGLEDFQVSSEQYYLHTDPANQVLATCDFPNPSVEIRGGMDPTTTVNPCKMPTVWIKTFGKGRVFYNALGHKRQVLEDSIPLELTRRGFVWATRS